MLESNSQFNVKFAGRRSYKTETTKRKLILGTKHHAGLLTKPNGKFFYSAPTQKQAKRIAWDDFLVMTQPFWGKAPDRSNLVITTNIGSSLTVLGMDAPERVEGSMWDGGALDEYDNMKENVFAEHVQPVTSDTGAWIDFVGVPEGRRQGYELAMKAKNDESGRWSFWTWHSSLFLPDHIIQSAREDLDERTFRQEYEAEFNTLAGVCYYVFDDDCVADIPFRTDADTVIACDFNAGERPMAFGLLQREDNTDHWHVVREFVFQYSNTDSTCIAVKSFLQEHKFNGSLIVCGDYAGRRRESSASFSDYETIEYHFKNFKGFEIVTRPTLSVRDRVASLNTRLRNGAGKQQMKIDRSCVELIKDLREVEWRPDGVKIDDRNAKRTHISDAVSYFTYNFYPVDHKEAVRVS